MLLNIVRSRYQEMPVFLEISSVVTQYSYDRSLGLGYFREFINNPRVPTSDTASADVNVAFSEFPTISYTPLTGEAFARHLYSEIPSELLFAAVQSGWAVDVLMRIALHRFGAAENLSFGEVRIRQKFATDRDKLEHFSRAVDSLLILSHGQVIGVEQVKGDEKAGTETEQYLVVAEEVPEDLRPRLAELRQLLGITNGNRFRITGRTTDIGDDEISIQTRSLMAIVKFMARGVEIPLEHREQGRVVDYGLNASVVNDLFPFIMRSSKNRPDNAFAAVRYEDYWYSIDQADIASKRALEHVLILFQLTAPPSKSSAPLLTLPTR